MYVLFTIIVFDSMLLFFFTFAHQKMVRLFNRKLSSWTITLSKKAVGKLKDAQINNYN